MPKVFPCTQCGCCCRRVRAIIELGIGFPYKAKEDGSCEMLTEDNNCKVYDSRPFICNISEVAKILNKDIDEYYAENIEICNKIMDEDNIPIEFRIKTE